MKTVSQVWCHAENQVHDQAWNQAKNQVLDRVLFRVKSQVYSRIWSGILWRVDFELYKELENRVLD